MSLSFWVDGQVMRTGRDPDPVPHTMLAMRWPCRYAAHVQASPATQGQAPSPNPHTASPLIQTLQAQKQKDHLPPTPPLYPEQHGGRRAPPWAHTVPEPLVRVVSSAPQLQNSLTVNGSSLLVGGGCAVHQSSLSFSLFSDGLTSWGALLRGETLPLPG